MFADRVEQARKQEFARRIGARQETGNQIPRASAFPFLMGKTRRIDESAIGFVAVEKAFLKQAIESGHHRGVSQWPAQLRDDIADAACSVGPENLHELEFKSAESQRLA